jgi:SAM-dependent methyltransferase
VTTKDKPLFISQNIEVLEGDAAEQALRKTNDARFFEAGKGVSRVDEQRWQEAQSYERKTWMERGKRATDDRNRFHRERFAGYSPLKGMCFQRAIELGCGPFTNMRLILEVARATNVHLLDPLITDYVRHALCRYRNGKLGGVGGMGTLDGLLSLRAPLARLRETANSLRIGGPLGRDVKLEHSAIEDFSTPHQFDLVVLINVLEHCRDANKVFAKVWEILAPSGIVVFHDRFLPSAVLAESLANLYDAGHPIRLDSAVVETFLRRFQPLMRADYWDRDVFAERELPRQAIYYIGRRAET